MFAPPVPPPPERAAELRRAFAEEARGERPDLTSLCLLVAACADGSLDQAGMDAAQMELDRLAGELPYQPGTPLAWAEAVGELLGGRHGFHGLPADYQRLDSSLLHSVLRRRRGLPILLSVVWLEVARRAGGPVYGVALPGHFVVGFGRPGERVLADPFDSGRILVGEDARMLVAGATGAPLDSDIQEAARTDEVVLRILNNIRAWAAARPEHSEVALWALELSLLLPSHPAKLRQERAELLVQRGDYLSGAAEYEAYAEVVAVVDEAAAERLRGQARAARAMLN
ncbi:tetratricopeptide repeat protein [Streptomyces sp. NPDC058045]|uniref:transglutaminase family protein n=1 Tax=Streptomyces sp. NPDC058045 TaxID=3346311 RepID=UPI0036E81843